MGEMGSLRFLGRGPVPHHRIQVTSCVVCSKLFWGVGVEFVELRAWDRETWFGEIRLD